MVVWTVPEHKGGLGSPRAREVQRKTIYHLYYYFVYFFCSVKSNLTRLVKKVDGYSTSYCLLVFSSKQLHGTYK